MNDRKNNPRIGIITFHRAINYGALLQAYALQKVLKNKGFRCDIIDYRNYIIENQYKEKTFADCHSLKDIGKFILNSKFDSNSIRKFRQFLSTHVSLSDPYYSIGELQKIASGYDKLICGSDQVWNYTLTNFDKAYFLDFADNKLQKYSYAASFGFNNIPADYLEEYRTLLLKFNNISIRERRGAEILKTQIGINAEVVLDPTMLLSKQDWENITEDYKNKKEYILLYVFWITPIIKNFVKKLANLTGCSIVFISNSLIKKINATYERSVGPTEFLGLFKNARYIVTNSFHGMVFAINFNKDFFLEMMPESLGLNSRLYNVLDVFNLRARQIISGENNFIKDSIDYNQVNKNLLIERKKSLEYLNKIIES